MSANSDFVLKRIYKGKVKTIILDWSGTTADAYVIAPAVVFLGSDDANYITDQLICVDGGYGMI